MADFIDREALMKFPIRRDHCDKEHANEHFINGIETVMEYAENLPTADVEPVRHGRWICVDTDTEQFFLCNRCKKKEYWESNYCPNCGCRMDGGNE